MMRVMVYTLAAWVALLGMAALAIVAFVGCQVGAWVCERWAALRAARTHPVRARRRDPR